MVIIHHCYGYTKSISPIPIEPGTLQSLTRSLEFVFHRTVANGFLGVMIFFVLSGFCIRWSHLNTKSFTWKNFYLRRSFRILPAYWIWLFIGALLAAPEARDILLHVLLIHNLDKETYYSIVAPFWSIAIEWQIYLLYPIVVVVVSKFSKSHTIALFAVLGIGSSVLASNPVSDFLHSDAFRIFGRLPTALMFAWVLGLHLADSVFTGSKIGVSFWKLFSSAAVGILAYTHPYTCILAPLLWSFAAYHLVALFVTGHISLPPCAGNLLARIGIISYSLYLCHDLFSLYYPKIGGMLHIGSGTFLSGAAATFLLLPVILLVGYVSYRWIEVPGTKLGKMILSRRRAKS